MALLGRLRVDLLANSAQFRKEMASVQKRMRATGKSLTQVGKGLTLGVTAPIVGLAAAAVKLASDSAEAGAKFETVFGGAADAVNASIQEMRKTIPATTEQLQGMSSGIQDLLVPLGLAPDAAVEMTDQVVRLAGDLASFNNIPVQEALEGIRSGLVGQNEPLLKFGVAIDIAKVKARALEMGLYSGKGALDAGARAQAAFSLTLEKTTAAHGDAARTAESTANQFKFLRSGAEELGGAIGAQLLPVVTPIVTKLVALTKSAAEANPMIFKVGAVIGVAAAAIGPLVLAIGTLSIAMGALNLTILPVVAVVAAVGAAVALATVIWVKWGDDIKLITRAVIKTVQPAWDKFAKAFVAVAVWLKDNVIKPVWDMVKRIGTLLAEVLGKIIGGVIKLFEKVPVFLRPPLIHALFLARDFVDGVKENMELMRDEAVPVVVETVEAVAFTFGQLPALVLPPLDETRRGIIGFARQSLEGVQPPLIELSDTVKKQATDIGVHWAEGMEAVASTTKTTFDAVVGSGGILDEFGGEFGKKIKGIVDDVTSKFNAIKGLVESIGGLLGKLSGGGGGGGGLLGAVTGGGGGGGGGGVLGGGASLLGGGLAVGAGAAVGTFLGGVLGGGTEKKILTNLEYLRTELTLRFEWNQQFYPRFLTEWFLRLEGWLVRTFVEAANSTPHIMRISAAAEETARNTREIAGITTAIGDLDRGGAGAGAPIGSVDAELGLNQQRNTRVVGGADSAA